MKDGIYKCKKCGEYWEYFPDDYAVENEHSEICPLCSMPNRQMLVDIWEEEGLKGISLMFKILFAKLK